MNTLQSVKFYSPAEERINIASHALGLVLSLVGLALLVVRANAQGNILHVASCAIFGASLVMLYATSTTYHSARTPAFRHRMRVVDHAMIYVLIAGSYTPITLITMGGATGWLMFGIAWGMAFTGILLKLFFTGRFNLLSTLMYVFMGWILVLGIEPLIDNLPANGLIWLLSGGIAYTLGAVLYAIKKIRFNHAIFHIFVLLGSAFHFVTVYFYVLPGA
jgi:hemolysin III